MIYYADIKDNLVQGFYCKEIHGDNIPETAIPITEELWQELLKMGQAELIDVQGLNVPSTLNISEEDGEEFTYGLEYVECFTQHVTEVPQDEQSNYVPVEQRMSDLEHKVDDLTTKMSRLISVLESKQ